MMDGDNKDHDDDCYQTGRITLISVVIKRIAEL